MNDLLVRILVTIAVYWGTAFALGMMSGPAWGFTLGSAALLYLLASQMSSLDPAPEGVMAVPGAPALPGELQSLVVGREPESTSAIAELTAASCGVGVLDREFRLFWCNDTLAGHFGIQDTKSVIGEPVARLAHELLLADYLAAGKFSEPLRIETSLLDGRVLSLRVVRYIGTQWLLLSLDVTHADKLEAKRRDCMENALHELRAPIMVLSWSLDVMRERALDDPDARDRLISMTEQCRKMRQITEDLRNLSALEQAPEPPSSERVGVGTLLRVVQAEAEALAGGRQRVTLAADPGFDLLGSRIELASAFSNLAGNAVRYTPPGGEIGLTWRASAAGAEFVVEDTGIGVAKEHLPRLTERFYQADRSYSRKHGGAGLGLAIVKDVLDRHQATLEIVSEPGKGSRFTARFPAQRVTTDARATTPQSGPRDNVQVAPSEMPVPSGAAMLPPRNVLWPVVRIGGQVVIPASRSTADRAYS
jgi:two-component system phosphate regulon sensor histidine kinase PhoR